MRFENELQSQLLKEGYIGDYVTCFIQGLGFTYGFSGVAQGIIWGTIIGAMKRDTRSLDYSLSGVTLVPEALIPNMLIQGTR